MQPDSIKRFNQAYAHLKAERIVTDKEDFALKLVYSYSHIATISNGDKELPMRVAKRIEDTFGIPAVWLLHGQGAMLPGAKGKIGIAAIKYISDNMIYHIPPEKITGLAKDLSDKFLSNLERWCFPGLKGDFLSVTMTAKGLEPEYPKGSILVLKEMERWDILPAENSFVFLKSDNVLFATKITGKTTAGYKTQSGNIAHANIKRCYAIILGVPPAKR